MKQKDRQKLCVKCKKIKDIVKAIDILTKYLTKKTDENKE